MLPGEAEERQQAYCIHANGPANIHSLELKDNGSNLLLSSCLSQSLLQSITCLGNLLEVPSWIQYGLDGGHTYHMDSMHVLIGSRTI